MIKRPILQQDITILNVYMPNNRALKYVRRILIELQGEINESTIIVGDFSIPLSEMDRSNRQKISKDITELNSTINQMEIMDINRLLHPQEQSTHSSPDHMEHSPR